NWLTLYGGGAVFPNAGLFEATGAGGLIIENATIDDTSGGTLLGASGTVSLENAGVIPSAPLTTSGGGEINFSLGTNTVAGTTGTVTIAAGATLAVAPGYAGSTTLDVLATALDNFGT